MIDRQLRGLPEVETARTVHVYWPMLHHREVDTRPFIAWLYTHEKQIVLPVVSSSETAQANRKMEHRVFEGEDALVRSRWGIDEPRASEQVDVGDIDLVVVPALAADRRGNRIGYGGGYYDRFLSQTRAPRVCPVYDACLFERVPTEPHDVRMTIIVTETRVLRFE